MTDSGSKLNLTMSSVEKEKSWYLLGVLLSIGRPICPEELASLCSLFPASPDFIRYISSVSNSPLHLMENGLVTISMAAIFAFGELFSNTMNHGLVPRYRFWASEAKESRETDAKMHCRKRKGTVLDMIELSAAKRRLLLPLNEGERDQNRLQITKGIQDKLKEHVYAANVFMRRMVPAISFKSGNIHSLMETPLRLDTNGKLSCCPIPNVEYREANIDVRLQKEISGSVYNCNDTLSITGRDLNCQQPVDLDESMASKLNVNSALPTNFHDFLLRGEAFVDGIRPGNRTHYSGTGFHENHKQNNSNTLDDSICESHACKVSLREHNEEEVIRVESGSEMHALDLDKDDTGRNIQTQDAFQIALPSSTQKQLLKSSHKLKEEHKNDLHSKQQILMESLTNNKLDNAPKKFDQCIHNQKSCVRHKVRLSRNSNVHAKENVPEIASMTPKEEKKTFPSFDTFAIEEEEGSGGYGTVYRARRKNDGKRLAIKCPHDKAHKSHVINERNMLERFGGRNFIIKFEGSFKSGSSDCFVLEHVEHDRPEVLKKEIDIFQLQWYGYCMFRALACLHKEGVVHRDVKPGNFLFSRKINKGYLIDFNLAMDLKQKFSIRSKSKTSLDESFDNIPLPSSSAPTINEKNLGESKSLTSNLKASASSKPISQLNKHVKQKAYAGLLKSRPVNAGGNLFGAQGTDGSGITSAKDVTSTRTPSTERLREPLPFIGRKELISLVQNSMQCTDHSSRKGPASQRKRIAAPSGKVDGKKVYLTPMPVHSSTVAAGLLRSKGDGKHNREGSCVGTKGFRAPEVLLRSRFQGPKVDIWSAGVTLLYLMIGKTPFTGDPEQNIKDIAKLRSSEDLWEVAKLHDRELSFPVELFHERYLQSLDLECWCRIHTKRPQFIKHIPKSLFDLIDKCLQVNPRLRISAEEALKHEFFASCHESLRKQRMMQRGVSLGSTGIQSNNLVDRLFQ